MKRLPGIGKGVDWQRGLFRGHLTGQLVLWIATIGYAHLYGAEAYGLFALFLSVVNVCGLLACLGFEVALLLPVDEDEVLRLLSGCLQLVTCSTILVGGLLYLFRLPGNVSLPVGWLALSVWGQGILVVRQEWYTRLADYNKLGRLWQHQYMLMAILQGMGYVLFPVTGLMVGYALALGILGGGFCWQFRHAFRVDRLLTGPFRSYWRVVGPDLGGRGIHLLARHIQPILLVPCFGPKKAAQFFLAQQLLGKPLQALIAAVRSPFLNRSKEWLQAGDWSAIRRDVSRVIRHLSVRVSLVWFLLIAVFNTITAWLPMDWHGLVVVTLFMLPLYAGKVCFSPVSGLAPLLGKTNWTFSFNGFLFVWSLISLGVGYVWQAFPVFLFAYSLGVGLGYFWLYHRFTQYLKHKNEALV